LRRIREWQCIVNILEKVVLLALKGMVAVAVRTAGEYAVLAEEII